MNNLPQFLVIVLMFVSFDIYGSDTVMSINDGFTFTGFDTRIPPQNIGNVVPVVHFESFARELTDMVSRETVSGIGFQHYYFDPKLTKAIRIFEPTVGTDVDLFAMVGIGTDMSSSTLWAKGVDGSKIRRVYSYDPKVRSQVIARQLTEIFEYARDNGYGVFLKNKKGETEFTNSSDRILRSIDPLSTSSKPEMGIMQVVFVDPTLGGD